MRSQPRKPRAKYLGEEHEHPIEHGEDLDASTREEDLVGSTPHVPRSDLRPEEPSRESTDSDEAR
jgi:hypothetical protein